MLDSLPFKIDVCSRYFTRNCLKFDGFFILIKKQYILGNIQVGAGHFWLTYFPASVGLFFWKIPDEQFNLGHWSLSYSLLNQQHAKA